MGFNQNSTKSNNNARGNAGNQGGIPDDKKAEGFLNLYLPAPQGGGARRKLGAITLRKSNQGEMTLAAWLTEDPTRVSIILQHLELEYNPAESPNPGFDIDGMMAAKSE